MPFPQKGELDLKRFARGVMPRIVVAKNTGQGERQPRQRAGNPALAIAEIPNHKETVRCQGKEKFLIGTIPLIMQIPGNRHLEIPSLREAVFPH
jgi:hypothetical protein